MKDEILRRLNAARAEKRPAALITDLESGAQALLIEDEVFGERALGEAQAAAARAALARDASATVEGPGGPVFIHVFNPPLRLIIVGAVHITQPLARVAGLAGYRVAVVDPRRAFADDARFPGVAISRDWPDEALRALAPDSRTAVVTLTHDPKLDDPALDVALRSPAFYIGALGSRRTHAKRCARLAEMGHDAAAIARIHGPVGLDIGARSPAEIAIAIMAEITATRRKDARAEAVA